MPVEEVESFTDDLGEADFVRPGYVNVSRPPLVLSLSHCVLTVPFCLPQRTRVDIPNDATPILLPFNKERAMHYLFGELVMFDDAETSSAKTAVLYANTVVLEIKLSEARTVTVAVAAFCCLDLGAVADQSCVYPSRSRRLASASARGTGARSPSERR